MSSNLDAAVGIEHVHHIKRGQVTRLTWNGWMVDIDGVGVPLVTERIWSLRVGASGGH